jgi:hypothetical protein
LTGDLRSVKSTVSYAFVSPGLCDDTTAASCPAGEPTGLVAEDAFLKQ